MIGLCHFGGDLIFANDGTASYVGGEAIALPIEVTDFSVFKAEVANQFHLSVEDVLLKYLYRGIISTLLTLSSDEDLKFLNVLFGADGVAVIFASIVNHGPSCSHTVASNPVTGQQPEKLSLGEFHGKLVKKGHFTKDFIPWVTQSCVKNMVDEFMPQLEMRLVQNPNLSEQAVEVLSNFKKNILDGKGLGDALEIFEDLIKSVKNKDAHNVKLHVAVLKKAFILANDKLTEYYMILNEENQKKDMEIVSNVEDESK